MPVISLVSTPAAGFVAEESYQYFSRSRRDQRIGAIHGPLFDQLPSG
jgi:hypothetical protein